MENKVLFANMIKDYNKYSYTHNYIFGYTDNKNVFAVITTNAVLPYILTLDKASNNCGYALRYKPNKAQKQILETSGTIQLICSKMYFDTLVANSKYNRGEIFEKLVTEKAGQVWSKDNVPFTDAGDIEIDGIAYQIKYEKATFVNEKGLENLAKKASL